MKKAIFGIGGQGRELLVLYMQSLQGSENHFEGWYDDAADKGSIIMGYPVLGSLEDLNQRDAEVGLFIGLGDARTKKKVVERINNAKVHYPNLIHPSVSIEDYQLITMGKGVIIQVGCVLTTNIKLDDFVFLNLNCTVGHDTNIGKYSSFMPGVHVSGDVVIGEACYFGTNATIINALTVKKGAVIGAGACVSKEVNENTINVGIPSKPIRTLEDI